MENHQLIRLPLVLSITGLKRSTLYFLMKKGSFPKQVKLSERCAAWRRSEVEGWLASRQKAA